MHFFDLLSKSLRYLYDSDYRFAVNRSRLDMYRDLPDEEYLKRMFRYVMGYDLNLNNPQTFNEKLQWLKLYDRKPIYTTMVDKYEAKKYVANIIGKEYIIPTLGVWKRFEDIDFTTLPNQFVLKCTHDSGGLVICEDKAKLDIKKAKKKITKSLEQNFYYIGREWPYKNVKPRIIAEQYMEDDVTHELRDYKFFTFNGVAKALFIACDRQAAGEETKFDLYDMDFIHLPFTNGHTNADVALAKPETFAEMKELAEKLSKGIPHVHVDFYEVNGKAYFGELTFSHWSGFVPFDPPEWDKTFGDWIDLPEKFGGGKLKFGKGWILWLHEEKEAGKTTHKELTDYKFMCFDGQVKCSFVCTERFSKEGLKVTFFDRDWHKMPFERHYPASKKDISKPVNYEKMIELAEKLSKDIPFVRVDFYETNNHIYFGELTFYPGNGMEEFTPIDWDYELGSWINLPEKIGGGECFCI